jgi:hypothetical protein
MRRRSSSLKARSLACHLCRIVCRSTVKGPFRVLPQLCVNPFRVAAELDDSRFVGMQLEAKPREIRAHLAMAAFLHGVGIPKYLPLMQQGMYFTAQYPTCTFPCQRFDAALASSSA